MERLAALLEILAVGCLVELHHRCWLLYIPVVHRAALITVRLVLALLTQAVANRAEVRSWTDAAVLRPRRCSPRCWQTGTGRQLGAGGWKPSPADTAGSAAALNRTDRATAFEAAAAHDAIEPAAFWLPDDGRRKFSAAN